MTKIRLGARQGALLRYVAGHPGTTSVEASFRIEPHMALGAVVSRMGELYALGAVNRKFVPGVGATWTVADAGREWLATRANPLFVSPKPKRLVIGRKMRACVTYVATHEGCTKYAAGRAVARPGHPRDGWATVQRAIEAGLISVRKRRDGTTALSVTEAGRVS